MFGLKKIIKLIQKQEQILKLCMTDKALFLHGDLHTGNILFNDFGEKLIDPRGDFIDGSTYFDVCYDTGKLLHDLHAKYSLVRGGHFDLKVEDNSYWWSVKRDAPFATYEKLLAYYYQWMQREQSHGNDSMLIPKALLSEGLLLCGIVPFHLKHTERSIVLLISGIVLLNKWYGWSSNKLAISDLFLPLDYNS